MDDKKRIESMIVNMRYQIKINLLYIYTLPYAPYLSLRY